VLDLATTKLMGYMRNCTREEKPVVLPPDLIMYYTADFFSPHSLSAMRI
jgi:hypothetical protein